MTKLHTALLLCGIAFVAACSEEPPPRTVQEYLENPIVLEAAMVRCSQNRDKTRYEPECVNARQAVSILEAKEERERAKQFEAQSERKREALRRTQAAAAEARRRAAEAERRRREAAYLAQFGELPPAEDGEAVDGGTTANEPGMVAPDPEPVPAEATAPAQSNMQPASDGSNAPGVDGTPPSDLNAIREELQRRSEETGN